MEQKYKELIDWIQMSKETTTQQIEALVQDQRSDDARPIRASLNIYDVFVALFQTAYNKSKGDISICVEEFHKLATTIPANWSRSLEAAKQHDDAEKILIEEAKLDTAKDIIAKFDSLFVLRS